MSEKPRDGDWPDESWPGLLDIWKLPQTPTGLRPAAFHLVASSTVVARGVGEVLEELYLKAGREADFSRTLDELQYHLAAPWPTEAQALRDECRVLYFLGKQGNRAIQQGATMSAWLVAEEARGEFVRRIPLVLSAVVDALREAEKQFSGNRRRGLSGVADAPVLDHAAVHGSTEGAIANSHARPPGNPLDSPKSIEAPKAAFKRSGDDWLIGISGDVKPIPHRVGLLYIHALLASAGQPLASSTLFALKRPLDARSVDIEPAAEGLFEQDVPDSGADPILDSVGITRVRAALARLTDELTDLGDDERNDEERARLEDRINQLTSHLREAVGPSGLRRKLSDPVKKQRRSVGQEITRTIRFLCEKVPEIGEHLEESIRHRASGAPIYQAAAVIAWSLR